MNSDRIYQGEDERWYFNVRGNLAKGPFPTCQAAEDALNLYLRRCRQPLATLSLSGAWSRAVGYISPGRRVGEPRHP